MDSHVADGNPPTQKSVSGPENHSIRNDEIITPAKELRKHEENKTAVHALSNITVCHNQKWGLFPGAPLAVKFNVRNQVRHGARESSRLHAAIDNGVKLW